MYVTYISCTFEPSYLPVCGGLRIHRPCLIDRLRLLLAPCYYCRNYDIGRSGYHYRLPCPDEDAYAYSNEDHHSYHHYCNPLITIHLCHLQRFYNIEMYTVVILVAIFLGLLALTYWIVKMASSSSRGVVVGRKGKDALVDTSYGRMSKYRCTPINQHDCNACWAIAMCQTISDRMHIHNMLSPSDELNYYAFHDIIVDKTPGIDGCDSGIPLEIGLKMFVQEGAPLMSESIDRVFDDTPIATDVQQIRYRINGWRQVHDIKRELHSGGPVVAVINLYQSFYSFNGKGVYSPRVGESIDGAVAHMVSIVGYDDRDSTWIVRNSHGTSFGNGGYCKIHMGDSRTGIDDAVYAPIL